MADRSKVIDRIKKLFNLGDNNPSQEEAEQALMLAQEMMVRHHIDQKDLLDAGVDPEKVIEVGVYNSRRIPFWVDGICSVVADNFRCKVYRHGSNEKWVKQRYTYDWESRFVGLELDAQIAQQVFNKAIEFCDFFCEWALMELKFEKGDFLTKSERAREDISFRAGFVRGLKDKFDEQVRRNNWALVLVTPGLVLAHMDEHHNDLVITADSKAKVRNLDTYAEGKKRGGEFVDKHGTQNQAERGPKRLTGNKGE